MVDYRTERQGANHWEVIDARVTVERWQRLTAVAAKDRVEVVRALLAAGEGSRLQQRLRYREAEAKQREVLAIYRKVLGEQHPETAASYNNVAFCLQSQGRHGEALPLYQKALALTRRVLGERHLETGTSYNNVAFSLQRQGRIAEALPLYHKALAINRKVLGEQHPDTATSSPKPGLVPARSGQVCRGAAAVSEGAGAQPEASRRAARRHRPKLQQRGLLPEQPGPVRPGVPCSARPWPLSGKCWANSTLTPPPVTAVWAPA